MASPERVSLRYGDCRAEVLLRGGQICSLRGSDGREAIWQADPAVWPQHAMHRYFFPCAALSKMNR